MENTGVTQVMGLFSSGPTIPREDWNMLIGKRYAQKETSMWLNEEEEPDGSIFGSIFAFF